MKLPPLMPIVLSFVAAIISQGVACAEPPAQPMANAAEYRPEDLALEEAYRLMASGSRAIQAGRRAMEGLEADKLSAGQRPNPTLSINTTNIQLDRSNGSGGLWDKQFDSVVRVDQMFERGNKRELRLAVAEQSIRAGQLDLSDLIRQQRVALAAAYFNLVLAQEKERINRDNQALYTKTLQAAALRLKAGDIATADLARIRVDALRAENDWRQSVAEREKAQSMLAYLIGRDGDAPRLRAADAWPAIALVPVAAANEELLLERADVRAAQARVDQADQARKLSHALRTRDITVGVQYEHFPTDSRNTIGAGVSIPLFTNYEYQGEIARAEVNYTAALEDLERVKAQAMGEIARARADLDAAVERTRRFDEAVLSEARKAADAAEFAYQHGALGVMDLLDARRTLRALELESAATHADYAKADVAWRAAINLDNPTP